MKYVISGVQFTRQQLELFLTIKKMLNDVNQKEEEGFNLNFNFLKAHIEVLRHMADWFIVNSERMHDNAAVSFALSNTVEKYNVSTFEDLCSLFLACNYFEFELLMRALEELIVEAIPTNFYELKRIFEIQGENDDFSESERLACNREVELMRRTLPDM